MGRFASTVPYYSRYREPYPPAFFATVAERLPLEGQEKLIDLGCGPGLVAIGFAPYVGSSTGVDPEPGMIAAAASAAAEAGVDLKLVQGRMEDLPPSIGVFDLVTIGRAHHWLERETALQVLDGLVAEDGAIIMCGSPSLKAPVNPWAERYDAVRRAWSSDPHIERYPFFDVKAWLAGSRFRVTDEITVRYRHQVTIADLVGRALSKSTTSPEALGDRRPAFEAALTEALTPFAQGGVLDEEVEGIATVARRTAAEP